MMIISCDPDDNDVVCRAWPCMRRNSPSHRCKQGILLDADDENYDDCDDEDEDDDDDDGRGHMAEATGANSLSPT